MAVTRIKNNQITDKTITYAKVADFTITGGQLANSLVYSSDLTVQGNLTVSGTTTVVDSTNTTVADPLTLLASGISGSPVNDVGFLINRGSSISQALVWNEANNEFGVFATTATSGSSGAINNSGYSDFHAGSFIAGNLEMTGNSITSTNDDLNLTASSGNVVANNMTITNLTADRIPYVAAGGYLNTTNYLTFDPVTGDLYSETVQGGNLKLANNTLSSTDTDGNINIVPNGAGLTKISNLSVTGLSANSVVVVNDVGQFVTDGQFTFNGSTNLLTLNGTANIGNLSIHGNDIEVVTGANLTLTPGAGGNVVASDVAITGGVMDDVTIGGTTAADATFVTANAANVFVSHLTAGRVTYASTNGQLVDDADLTFDGTDLGVINFQASGNVTAGNVSASNLTQGRVVVAGTTGHLEDNSNLTFDGTTLTVTGNIGAGNTSVTGLASSANLKITSFNQNKVLYTGVGGAVTSGNLEYNGTVLDVGATGNITAGNVTAGYVESTGNANAVTFNGNLEATNANITGTANIGNVNISGSFGVVDLTASGNVIANTVTANANLSAGNISTGGELAVTGNANVGALITVGDANIGGNVIADNVSVTGNVDASTFNGNLVGDSVVLTGNANAATFNGNLSGTTVTITGNANVGNVNASGAVSATGNVSGGNLSTVGDVSANNAVFTNSANAVTFNGNLNGDSSTVTGNSNASIFNGNLIGATANLTGNVDGGNINTTGVVSATGNVSGGNLTTVGDVSANNAIITGYANATTFNGNLNGDSSTVTGNSNASIFNGNLIGATANLSGNVDGGNLNTTGVVSATGNVSGGNLTTVGTMDAASANVTGTLTAGNVDAGNLAASSLTSGRVVLAGASGALVDNSNLTFNGTELSVTGNVKADNANIANIEITPNTITNTTVNGNLTFSVNGTGVFSFSNVALSDVADPVSLQDAVTLSYLNNALSNAVNQITEGDSGIEVDDTGVGNIITTVDGSVVSYSVAAGTTFIGNATVDNVNISGNTITTLSGSGEALNLASDTGIIHMNGDVEITGNLQIGGDQTIVDVTNLAVTDPVINVGTGTGNSPLTTDDGYDRGLAMHYYHSSDKEAALVMANQDDKLYWYKEGTVSAGQYSGTLGNIVAAGFEGNTITLTGNANVGAVNSTGDVSGNNVVATNNSNANVFNGNTMEIAQTANVTGNLSAGNISTSGSANVTDTLTAGNVVVSALTSGRVTFAGASGVLTDDGDLTYDSATNTLSTGEVTVTGNLSGANVFASSLTNGRVVLAGASGQLVDDADITFDTGTNELTVTNANITGNLTLGGALDLGLTQGYVTFGGVAGELAEDADLTFDTASSTLSVGNANVSGTLTAGGITDSALTSGRIVYSTTGGELTDSASLAYNDISDELTVTNANVTGNLLVGGTLNLGLTSGRVAFAGVSGELTEDADLTFDTASNTLGTGNANVVGSLTAGDIYDSNLTSGRVVFASTNGQLVDDTNFTFDNATDTLYTGNANVSGTANVGNLNVSGSLGVVDLTASGNIVGNTITSNGNIDGTTLNVTTANVSGNVEAGNVNASGAITANGNVSGDNLVATTSVVSNGNIQATGNISTSDTINAVDGNVSANLTVGVDLTVLGLANVTGNINGGNLNTIGDVTANNAMFTGNANATTFNGNLNGTSIDITGTANVGNVNATGNVDAVAVNANVYGSSAQFSSLTQNGVIYAGPSGELTTSGGITYDPAAGLFELTGNANVSGSANIGGTLDAYSIQAGDLTQGRVVTVGASGQLEDNANLAWNNANATLTVTGNAHVGNIGINDNTISSLDVNGNIYLTPNGTGKVIIANASVGGYTANSVLVTDGSGSMTTDGNLTYAAGELNLTGNANISNTLVVGSLTIEGTNEAISAASGTSIQLFSDDFAQLNYNNAAWVWVDSSGAHLETSGGAVTLDNSGVFSVPGDLQVSSGNANIGTNLNLTGNAYVGTLTSGRVVLAGASGQLVDSSAFTYSGSDLTVTGNIYVGNLVLSGDDITSTNGEVTINGAGNNIDFNVAGTSNANLFFVNASGNNIGINTNTPNAEAKLVINSTDSFIIPIGATGDRPISPTAGMVRFNTTSNTFEGYNGTQWQDFSAATTVITSETFNGDGSTTVFTLGLSTTTAACMVAINGVMQIPTTAYSISGTTLTFTEAPAAGDLIEVRELSTSSTINVTLQSPNGYNLVAADNSSVTIFTGTSSAIARWVIGTAGDFVPGVTNTLSIGSSAAVLKDVWMGGAIVSKPTLVTAGTTATTIDSFAKATYRTAKYVVQVENLNGTSWDSMEVLVTHDGSDAYVSVYGAVETGSSLGSVSAEVSGSDVLLRYTGLASGNKVKIAKTYIVV